jgi:hypothetical protein
MIQQSLFSISHKLGGHAQTSVWGLASSPLGDLVASLYSHDPSHAITYYVSQDRSSTLLINPVEKSGDDTFQLPVSPNYDPSESKIGDWTGEN